MPINHRKSRASFAVERVRCGKSFFLKSMYTRTFLKVEQIPQEDWDKIVGTRSRTLSYAFWKALEASQLNEFSYRYLMLYNASGILLGFITAYIVTTDIAIFAPPTLRKLLVTIRQWLPNFLKWRMLECGTPTTINSPPWVCSSNVDEKLISHALLKEINVLAKKEKTLITVIRDFAQHTVNEQHQIRKLGYEIVQGLPNAILPLPYATPDQYLQHMRSYYRSKLLKHVRKCEQTQVTYSIVEDFSAVAEVLHRQWMLVHENAQEYQREVLTPSYYRQLAESSDLNAKAVLIYREGILVAHAVLLFDVNLVRWLHFGRSQTANDSIYLFTAYAIIKTAIEAKMSALELAVTNYQIKLDLGAKLIPLNFAIRLWGGTLNPIAKFVYNLLNKPPQLSERQVFKSHSD